MTAPITILADLGRAWLIRNAEHRGLRGREFYVEPHELSEVIRALSSLADAFDDAADDAPPNLVAAIDAINTDNPEAAHGALDTLLIEQMSSEVKAAIMRLILRCGWWAAA